VREAVLIAPFVEHHPGHAARLFEHRHAHPGDVGELVSEAFAARVDQKTAFDHQGVRHDDLLRVGQSAEALIGGHVRYSGTEFKSPAYAIALISFVPEIARRRHLRDMVSHHRVVAAKAAGR